MEIKPHYTEHLTYSFFPFFCSFPLIMKHSSDLKPLLLNSQNITYYFHASKENIVWEMLTMDVVHWYSSLWCHWTWLFYKILEPTISAVKHMKTMKSKKKKNFSIASEHASSRLKSHMWIDVRLGDIKYEWEICFFFFLLFYFWWRVSN